MAGPLAPSRAVRGHALLAWLWLAAATPFLTDAACDIFVEFALAGCWMVLGIVWVILPLDPSGRLRSWPELRCWLSAGVAGCLGLFLAISDASLIARIALCESSLS
jgi:hypothetical protein